MGKSVRAPLEHTHRIGDPGESVPAIPPEAKTRSSRGSANERVDIRRQFEVRSSHLPGIDVCRKLHAPRARLKPAIEALEYRVRVLPADQMIQRKQRGDHD